MPWAFGSKPSQRRRGLSQIRRRLEEARTETQRGQVAEGFAAVADGAREVDVGAVRIGRESSRADRPQGNGHAGDDLFGAGEVGGAHLLEVAGAEDFVGGKGQ